MYGSGTERVEQLRWALFVELFAESATRDLDAIGERIETDFRVLNAKKPEQREGIARSLLQNERFELQKARKQQKALRRTLLLED